jgi:protein-S-isoprenylcysteine O-methyltransferase Ste14
MSSDREARRGRRGDCKDAGATKLLVAKTLGGGSRAAAERLVVGLVVAKAGAGLPHSKAVCNPSFPLFTYPPRWHRLPGMTTVTTDSPHPPVPTWFTTIISLLVGAAFFALWFWLLPPALGFRINAAYQGLRWLAAIPAVLGFAVAIRCVWDFGRTGHGTPAPMAPPQRLVVVGFYRYVRNPMYVGFITGWIGLWIVFGRASLTAILCAAAVLLGVHLFVRYYEEPTLRKKFGEDYTTFCVHVPRWLPRLHPYTQES